MVQQFKFELKKFPWVLFICLAALFFIFEGSYYYSDSQQKSKSLPFNFIAEGVGQMDASASGDLERAKEDQTLDKETLAAYQQEVEALKKRDYVSLNKLELKNHFLYNKNIYPQKKIFDELLKDFIDKEIPSTPLVFTTSLTAIGFGIRGNDKYRSVPSFFVGQFGTLDNTLFYILILICVGSIYFTKERRKETNDFLTTIPRGAPKKVLSKILVVLCSGLFLVIVNTLIVTLMAVIIGKYPLGRLDLKMIIKIKDGAETVITTYGQDFLRFLGIYSLLFLFIVTFIWFVSVLFKKSAVETFFTCVLILFLAELGFQYIPDFHTFWQWTPMEYYAINDLIRRNTITFHSLTQALVVIIGWSIGLFILGNLIIKKRGKM